MRSRSSRSRLSADRSGATIVEFALVFPALLLITMGIIQVGWLFIATRHLENAVADLGRMARTGQVQDANLGQAEFRALLCQRMKPILTCDTSNLLLDVQVVPDALKPAAGKTGALVMAEVAYTYKPLLSSET